MKSFGISTIIFSLILMALLSSCDLLGAKPNVENPKANSITGKVQSYTGGDATLEARLALDFVEGAPKVGQGSIKADGSFTVTLNDTIADENLDPLSDLCEGVTVTPNTVKGTDLYFLTVVRDGKPIGDLLQASSPDIFTKIPIKYVAWVYLNQDASIKGTCQGVVKSTFNVSYTKGWNISLQELTQTSTTISTIESSDLSWIYRSIEQPSIVKSF
jgi:hypothetical protein